MSKVTIDASEIGAFADDLEKVDALIEHHLRVAMQAALDVVETNVAARTPVNTGVLRAAYGTSVNVRGQGVVRGTLNNPMIYGLPVERGRRPGQTAPPREAIELWVKRKLGLQGKEAQSAAFLIARAIGRRGIPAVNMVQEGIEASERTVFGLFEKVPALVGGELTGG